MYFSLMCGLRDHAVREHAIIIWSAHPEPSCIEPTSVWERLKGQYPDAQRPDGRHPEGRRAHDDSSKRAQGKSGQDTGPHEPRKGQLMLINGCNSEWHRSH